MAWSGFKVIGKVAPKIVKPVPTSDAVLMATGAVPVDDRVTNCLAGALTVTLPKSRLLVLKLSVGIEAFNCSAICWDTPPALAVSVTTKGVLTGDTTAANPV